MMSKPKPVVVDVEQPQRGSAKGHQCIRLYITWHGRLEDVILTDCHAIPFKISICILSSMGMLLFLSFPTKVRGN